MRVRRFVAKVFRRQRAEDELDAEPRACVAEPIDRKIATGMDADEAQRQALRTAAVRDGWRPGRTTEQCGYGTLRLGNWRERWKAIRAGCIAWPGIAAGCGWRRGRTTEPCGCGALQWGA